MTYRTENGWVIDERNNRASIERWGGEEAAKRALQSCYDCSDCSDCSRCSDCSDCYDCYDCSDCSPHPIGMEIPVIEDIHRKVYEAASQPGALCMSEWHTCETTHCRAGWVTTLAGEAGRKLEEATSPLFAAQQIYKASGYEISPVRFFDGDVDAMADMRRLATTAS